MLMSKVQILSPLRFNTPFNYQTVHLCKHPHPLLPEPETERQRERDRQRETDTHTHIHTHTHTEADILLTEFKKIKKNRQTDTDVVFTSGRPGVQKLL